MVTVFSLLVVILTDGGSTSFSRDYKSELECRMAEAFMQENANRTLEVIDFGTVCVKSELNPNKKPRA